MAGAATTRVSSSRPVRCYRRYAPAFMALLVGLASSLAMFQTARRWERERMRTAVNNEGQERAVAISRTLESNLVLIKSLAAFYAVDKEITRGEFREFVKVAGGGSKDVQSLEWIPRVPDSLRPAYEQAARSDGLADFQITERAPQGRMVRAATRPEYFPVYYVEPHQGNEIALGFDLASDPTRLEVLNQSRDTGKTLATARVIPVQEQGNQYGFLIFQPVYRNGQPSDSPQARRENFVGFVVGVFRIADLLKSAHAYVAPSHRRLLHIHLYDQSVDAGERFLEAYTVEGDQPAGTSPPDPRALRGGLHHAATVLVAGRQWSVVCTPTLEWIAKAKGHSTATVLGIGLLITVLSTGYLLVSISRRLHIERLAGELADANGQLRRENADRKRAEEQLRQAQKMEAIGQLAGGVAHDFNNILTGITGYAQLALEQLPPGSALACELTEIRTLVDRAARLTQQLLAFGRRQTLEPVVLDPNTVVADAMRMLKRIIGEHIELDFVPDDKPGRVRADRGQLEQVLMNLVLNARDAIGQGGRITVQTANIVVKQAGIDQAGSSVEPGDYVMLVVSDTGCGMPPEVQAHLFEPFFTTKPKGKGTGLGLATVYGIVRQHGGHIRVRSQAGQGATFEVCLPRVEAAVECPDAPVQPGTAPPPPRGKLGRGRTILVVADEPSVLDIARYILESHDYRVLVADGPDEAERLFAEHGERIALVLSDLTMQGCDGRQLCEKLAAARSGLKALYMSGDPADILGQHGMPLPGTGFIQKPFDPNGLLRKVYEVLNNPTHWPAKGAAYARQTAGAAG